MKPAPLQTKRKEARKKKRNQTLFGIIIILLMITSVIGYAALSNKERTQEQEFYNNQVFFKTDIGWQTQIVIDNKNIVLDTHYLPQEVENITSEGNPLLSDFKNKKLFLIATTENERGAAYLFNLLSEFTIRIQLACPIEESESEFCIENNLPIKGCEDSSFSTAIIQIKETNETLSIINFKNACLIIKGNEDNLIKATEKTLFMIFGII